MDVKSLFELDKFRSAPELSKKKHKKTFRRVRTKNSKF